MARRKKRALALALILAASWCCSSSPPSSAWAAPSPKGRSDGAPARSGNLRVALMAGGIAVSMLGLAYASVPLYQLFCQVTGFGGTTQRAEKAPENVTDTIVSVRFDANRSPGARLEFPCRPDRDEGQGRRAEHGLLPRGEHVGQAA
jgi:hypothetical protein